MGNLSTTDYIEGAAAVGLVYWGVKKSGWEKWALLAIAAYLAYGVYQDYSGGTTST
jgi:hypothetical protein